MIHNFVGTPGQPPRLMLQEGDVSPAYVLPGEVIIEGAKGNWVISADGTTLEVPAPDLDFLRAFHSTKIDEDAEHMRNSFLTPGSGQSITYLRKEMEAEAFLLDPLAPTPFLAAEAAALGIPIAELAVVVNDAAVLWRAIGARIEAARRCAKVAIENANTEAEILAASAVDWAAVAAS